MRKISKPLTPSAEETFLTCISTMRDSERKKKMESFTETIKNKAEKYNTLGNSANWYLLEKDALDEANKKIFKSLYNYYFREREPGKKIYNAIKAQAPQGLCPLCGVGTARTIDHYLPKTYFPLISIAPFNLIPCCSDCNQNKLTKTPENAYEQTIHPYYDDVSNKQWLFAKIKEEEPASFIFFTNTNSIDNEILKIRINHHFRILKLNYIYKINASSLLSDIKNNLKNLFNASGSSAIREHLQSEEHTRKQNHVNSWQTATFQAMSRSDWFCNGGFNF